MDGKKIFSVLLVSFFPALYFLFYLVIVFLKTHGKAMFTKNKAGYTATPVACGWAGAIIEVTLSFGQEQ